MQGEPGVAVDEPAVTAPAARPVPAWAVVVWVLYAAVQIAGLSMLLQADGGVAAHTGIAAVLVVGLLLPTLISCLATWGVLRGSAAVWGAAVAGVVTVVEVAWAAYAVWDGFQHSTFLWM